MYRNHVLFIHNVPLRVCVCVRNSSDRLFARLKAALKVEYVGAHYKFEC